MGGWLGIGDRILVEPAALRTAGGNGCEPGDSWYRRQALNPPWVPAHVAAVTGNGAVGVHVDCGGSIKPGICRSSSSFRSCKRRSRSQTVAQPLHKSSYDASEAIHWVHAERLRPGTKTRGAL